MEFKTMLDYCSALEKNNERSWFHENHKWYEQAREDYLSLLEMMRFVVAGAAPGLADDILYMSAKDWMYRIARDMRFYKDKPPYDPSFRAYISSDKKSRLPIGYFLRIAPGNSCIGTGIWCENTREMNKIRDHILENRDEFLDILDECPAPMEGSMLKTMPKGYSADDPAAEWLRYKNWAVIAAIPDKRLTTFEHFGEMTGKLIESMEPIRKFLLCAARDSRTPRQELEDFYRR